jgi:glycosyltransferase involved in cell wall biosynthesis
LFIKKVFFDLEKHYGKKSLRDLRRSAESENIGDAINYLLTHEAEAKQKDKNGRQAVELTFNWEKEEKKLTKVYEHLSQNLHLKW